MAETVENQGEDEVAKIAIEVEPDGTDEPDPSDADIEATYYSLRTDRLEKFLIFVAELLPVADEVESGATVTEVDPIVTIADDDLTSKRNLCLGSVFDAIRRIAEES
jgi:hypothetical protein